MTYDTSMYGAMTIGSILGALADLPHDYATPYGWDECDSYRGFYEELRVNRTTATIATMRAVLERAIGGTFVGYKGGEYVMTRHSGVWVTSDYSTTGDPINGDTIGLIRIGANA